MKFVIAQDLAQAIADYLAARPYREVAAMVRGLEVLQPLGETPTAEPEAPEPKAPRNS